MDDKFTFQKLTPIDNANLEVYDRAMQYVFDNADIRNIAISGCYGAGKSSMLESYKKANREKKFLHISLAHFEVDNQEETPDERKIISLLEGKIINQLVHQLEPKAIEQTNFRVKKDIDKKYVLKVTLLAVAFIAIVCFLCFKDVWERMVDGFLLKFLKQLFYFTTTKEIELVMGTIALVILGVAIHEVIRLQKLRRFIKRANIKGNEIDLFREEKDSYFDKYLDEVLYLFEHAKVDGIVFEDIDRYSKNLIFGKLREINYLLNTRVKEGEPIRFFYLLRDDIFTSKDRTKFFDFIIPIVPVVNASNAYDKFLEHFEEGKLVDLFDKNFLQGLSLYIDDMRMLKNICNEFVVYYERLRTSQAELNPNKLLAMVAYKNVFPGDFGNLQEGKGYVYTLFEEKETFREKKINNIKKEIERLQQENDEIDMELCNDIDELNAIYFAIDGRIMVDGREESGYKTRKDLVKAILKSKDIKRYSTGYSGSSWYATGIANEKQAMEQNEEYLERKQRIEWKSNSQTKKNEQRVKNCENQIEKLSHMYLRDLISKDNEQDVFATNYVNELGEQECFEEIKRSPYFGLIKYLICGGYIEESYPDYMTYFYPNSISVKDKNFLKSVAEKAGKPYEYELDNPALVISRMRTVDFKELEALNYDLLREMLSKPQAYRQELQNVMYGIWNWEPVRFVAGFLRDESYRKRLVEELNEYWKEAYHWILTTNEFSQSDKRIYAMETLCTLTEDGIAACDDLGELTSFIEEDADFLNLECKEEAGFKCGLLMLGVKFEDLNVEEVNERLLKIVYENKTYQFNKPLIDKLLLYFYGVAKDDILSHRSLTLILSKPEEPLCKYVEENLDLYIGVLLAEETECNDSEETVLNIVNSPQVKEENKRKYLALCQTRIGSLADINDKQLWKDALLQGKVAEGEENLCLYYFETENGADDAWVKYVNGFDGAFDFEVKDIDEIYGEGASCKLFNDIVMKNELNNSVYEKLVCAFEDVIEEFELAEVQADKVEILIRKRKLCMNKDMLDMMREHQPENVPLFVMANIKEYISLLEEDSMPWKEIHLLLKGDKQGLVLFRRLMEAEKLSVDSKKLVLAKQIEIGMNMDEALFYFEKLGCEKYTILLNGGRPKIMVSEENEALLNSLEKVQWISSHKISETEPDYYWTFGKKKKADSKLFK